MTDISEKNRAPETHHAEDRPQNEPFSLSKAMREWFNNLTGGRNGENSVRETLEEMIEERDEIAQPLDEHERRLLGNILALRSRTVEDVMVPRADIVSIQADASLSALIDLITREGHSRIPVYRKTLDDAVGMVHIRDVLAWRGGDQEFALSQVVRSVLFVAPSMQVPELLLEMRVKRCHMALVVDEYGGVDGLVTIEDLVEEIVGEIEDEHDRIEEPELIERTQSGIGGEWDADARVTVETLEARLGPFVTAEERADIDTLGGLVFSLAGRVPVRGELIEHPAGLEFEILAADPRRIRRLRVRRPKIALPAAD
ncbi:MAG: hemolysin family protein [Rhodospirillales bacterium]